MINKKQIQKNLTKINKLYNNPKNHRITLFFAKLAILEVCGWIEESMDEIIKVFTNKYLTIRKNQKFMEELLENTHGFHYEDDFRNMLMYSLGIINLERLESNFDPVKFQIMKSSIGILKRNRNNQAHTHLKGTSIVIDAPSVTIKHFSHVYNGLKDIENCIRRLKI